jgi:hypothetical protein
LLAELKGAFLGVVDQAMGFKRAMIAAPACPKRYLLVESRFIRQAEMIILGKSMLNH